jgi:serine/threonine protein kinase
MEHCDRPDYLAAKVHEVRLFINHLVQKHTPINNNAKLQAYSEEILEGIKYIHDEGIIHDDIKLENILMKTPDCKEEFL